jgi:hypothetical protein
MAEVLQLWVFSVRKKGISRHEKYNYDKRGQGKGHYAPTMAIH